MQSIWDDLELCRQHLHDARRDDRLADVAVIEQRIDHLLDSINKQRRGKRRH